MAGQNYLEISSVQNDLVKFCVKLQNSKFRKKEKLILVDGIKTISGLIEDGVEFEYIFLKKEDYNPIIKSKNIIYTNDLVLGKISTLKTPEGMVGIVKEPENLKNLFYDFNRIALIENVKDPGNLGTIIRSAVAFSIQGIILFGECVDLYNTKTLRATTQNIFKIPIISTNDIEFIKKLTKTHELISTVVNSKIDLFEYNFKPKTIVALGSEANGLSEKITNISHEKLSIKMDNNVESINLGVCASIVFAHLRHKLNK